jgi:DNA helicase II / ATP-dependent DNA helicase PcrA
VEHLHNYSANGMVVHNSVYGFRGADPRLLSEFPRTFPGAQVVVLEENHRSTRTIVSLANELAAPLGQRPASWTSNPEGLPARVYVADDDNEEAQFIAGEVARLLARGELAQPGQAAVLFRTNAQAQAFALALRARGLPVRLRSEADLFACPEVRDLVAYLRLAHSPQDQPALARILNTPPRRLRAVEQAFRKQPAPINEPTEWAHRRAGSAARAAVERLLALLAEIHAAARANRPVEALELVPDRTGYGTWLASSDRGAGPSRARRGVPHPARYIGRTRPGDLAGGPAPGRDGIGRGGRPGRPVAHDPRQQRSRVAGGLHRRLRRCVLLSLCWFWSLTDLPADGVNHRGRS